jgi:predicted nuclease of predicted toxin-antitoxin system
MRFLVDEDLPGSLVDLFARFGHEAVHVVDAGIRGAPDEVVAGFARERGMCLVTGDLDFSDVRSYPPREFCGIMVVRLPRNATSAVIATIVESFLGREDLVAILPGKLAVVEQGRARFRRGEENPSP